MIVHVITALKRGGAENALYRLLIAQPDPSTSHVVSLIDEGVFGAKLRAAGIAVTCLGMGGAFSSPRACLTLARLLRQLRPAVVQTWMYHADLLGGLAARMAGVPVCWGIRQGDLGAENNKLSTRLVALICAWLSYLVPKRIICCSARARAVHREFGYADRFVVIPNGLDLHLLKPNPDERAPVRQALGLAPEAYVVGHVARADPQKDHNNLITALQLVIERDPRPQLLLAGAGLSPEDGYLRKLLVGRGLDGRVLALGPRDDVPRLLQAMDVFVLSSAGEGFPNVVVEAMACGIPCVVTDVGDAAEIVGDTGWVVPPRDSMALAAALRKALHEPPQQRADRSAQARRRVEENYGIERMVKAYRSVWDEASGRRAEPCAV